MSAAQTRRWPSWVPIAFTAVLFGAAHAPAGWLYVGVATLAGVGYGWVYAATRRIEPAILTHFALNAMHFVFFTYPKLV